MQRLTLSQSNIIVLPMSAGATPLSNTNQALLSIYGEGGTPLQDNTGTSLVRIAAAWVDNVGFQKAIQFGDATPPQMVRVFWLVNDANGNAVSIDASYQPADFELVAITGDLVTPEALPSTLFEDAFLSVDTKLDSDYKNAVAAYKKKDSAQFRRDLLTAQGDIEYALKSKFFLTEETICRDYYVNDFRSNFWQVQTNHRPLHQVTSFKLVYGTKEIDITPDLASEIIVDPLMGTMEFLPTTVSGSLFTALMTNIAALGITILNDGGYSRVPNLFHITYDYGLDFPNLTPAQKQSIRFAIGRHAMINLLPILDPVVRRQSISRGIDGVSKSQSTGIPQLLKTYREDEATWIAEIQRDLDLNTEFIVV